LKSQVIILLGVNSYEISEFTNPQNLGEVWTRKKAGIEKAQVIPEVEALARAALPTWVGSEWIEKGVQYLCSEFDRSAK
jgi:hypothetical protein